jgi:hypothetical protein
MSFLDFYEKVQDRFSYEGARELYSFLKEMGVTSNLVELSENYKEFKNWKEAEDYFKMSKDKVLENYLLIPCVNGLILEIN